MRREIKYIANIEIDFKLENTSEQDKDQAFDIFKTRDEYDPTKEYVVVYNDSHDGFDIFELL